MPDGRAMPTTSGHPREVSPAVAPASGLALERLGPVERAILEAVTYADVFDWPLTPHEIHRYLPVPAGLDEVETALASPHLRGLASSIDHLVTLDGREHLARERRRRTAVSATLWPRAARYAQVVASLPFVRLVAVTGSLAIGAATDDADVDLFVVTEDGRLWLTRALTIGVVRAAAARRVRLCPNYFVAESALELRDRDLFTAHELVQMIPLAGRDTYRALLERNGWYRQFLPNHPGQPEPARPFARPSVRRGVERALRLRLIDRVERWEMDRKIARLTARARSAEMRFDESACKGHFEEHRRRALTTFRERLAQLSEAPA